MAESYIPVPRAELEKLLAGADGNAALLWLHVLATGEFSLGRAARELKCTETELLAAAAVLRGMGLLRERPEEQEPPEYDAEDLVRRQRSDPAYEAVVREAEAALGRVLNTNDLKLLYAINDFWGLPTDVMMLLLHHCVDRWQAQYGPGRKPTMRFVEREARDWAGREVRTLDDAEDLIRRERERDELTRRVAKTLQIRGRELTKSEREYVERWLGMGFGPEAIAIAYDRTMVGTGKLTWKYMDKILQRWQEKRLFTPEEIEAGDARRTARSAAEPERSAQDDLDETRRMLAHLEGKRKNGT